jgi:hypothetical protein
MESEDHLVHAACRLASPAVSVPITSMTNSVRVVESLLSHQGIIADRAQSRTDTAGSTEFDLYRLLQLTARGGPVVELPLANPARRPPDPPP